jgi:circadian clock protein KaiB
LSKPESNTRAFEAALTADEEPRYVLRLYVVGATPASRRAISAIRQICEDELADRYSLEVIDIYARPALAAGEQIIAAPTLIKDLPQPVRRLVGDMSDRERVLVGLDLRPAQQPARKAEPDGPK